VKPRVSAVLVAGALSALALPASAAAHAVLIKTVPQASVTLSGPPKEVALTYSEAVEPRFAIVSVTDAAGRQVSAGPPRRSPTNPDTLIVPLKQTHEGWYLVFWRAISVDGHPVRGAFTYAVGPNAGPAPQFPVPSTSESAATPSLLTARWITFLSVLGAIGLLTLRLAIARPVVRRVGGANLRGLSIAFCVAAAIGLVAIPVYLEVATADFALRSVFAIGTLVPLFHVSAFGRGYLRLELCFALFVAAGLIALWVDRPEREQRSIAELLAFGGAALAAAATLVVPGAAGHAGQTAPRGWSMLFDWAHLAAGSLWFGGLVGLLVLWWRLPVTARVAGLVVAVPRFSNVALGSVIVLIASGVGAALLRLPTVASLWQTSYGQALLVKVGLLIVAMAVASGNLLRTRHRLRDPDVGIGAARLLRNLVSIEAVLVTAIIFAAAVLSSLAPPSKALASVSNASAHVGPGPVSATVTKDGYLLQLSVSPNRAALPNSFAVKITKNGMPVRNADVLLTFEMLDMQMQNQEYRLSEAAPGVYSRAAPALVMVGHWGLNFNVTPRGGVPLDVVLVDRANG
jgi:copper transport protein